MNFIMVGLHCFKYSFVQKTVQISEMDVAMNIIILGADGLDSMIGLLYFLVLESYYND